MARLFKPGLSQPALLAEAVVRVYMLANAGRIADAGELAEISPRVVGSGRTARRIQPIFSRCTGAGLRSR